MSIGQDGDVPVVVHARGHGPDSAVPGQGVDMPVVLATGAVLGHGC